MNNGARSGFRDIDPKDRVINSNAGLTYDSLAQESGSASRQSLSGSSISKKLEPAFYVPYYQIGYVPSAVFFSTYAVFDMAASSTTLFAASISSNQIVSATTTDGVNWTSGTPTSVAADCVPIASGWTGSEFVLFMYNGTNTYGWYSQNGRTGWTNFWTFGSPVAIGGDAQAKIGVSSTKLFAYMGNRDFAFDLPLSLGTVTSKLVASFATLSFSNRVSTFGLHRPGAIIRGKYTEDCVTYVPVVNGDYYAYSANTTFNDLVIVGNADYALTSVDGFNWKRYNVGANLTNGGQGPQICNITLDDGTKVYATPIKYTTDFSTWYTYDSVLFTSDPYSGIGKLIAFKNMLVNYSYGTKYRLTMFGTRAELEAANLQNNAVGAYIVT